MTRTWRETGTLDRFGLEDGAGHRNNASGRDRLKVILTEEFGQQPWPVRKPALVSKSNPAEMTLRPGFVGLQAAASKLPSKPVWRIAFNAGNNPLMEPKSCRSTPLRSRLGRGWWPAGLGCRTLLPLPDRPLPPAGPPCSVQLQEHRASRPGWWQEAGGRGISPPCLANELAAGRTICRCERSNLKVRCLSRAGAHRPGIVRQSRMRPSGGR